MRIQIKPNVFDVNIGIEDHIEFDKLMTMLNFAAHSLDATKSVNEFAKELKSKLSIMYEDHNDDE